MLPNLFKNLRGDFMKEKFYYQPDIPVSISIWSLTLMIFLTGMMFWLEITVFQKWSAISFIIFIISVIIQLLFRYATLSEDKICFNAVISFNSFELKFKDINNITPKKYGFFIETKLRNYRIICSKKMTRATISAFNKSIGGY